MRGAALPIWAILLLALAGAAQADNATVPDTGDDGKQDVAVCVDAARRGDNDKAIALCGHALDADHLSQPLAAAAFAGRGLAEGRKADYAAAVADYGHAIALNPGESEFYYLRGLAELLQDNYDPAIQDATEAIRRAPDRGGYYSLRADAYGRKADNRAIADYAQAIRLGMRSDADQAELQLRQGVAAYLLGDLAQAREIFSAAVRATPPDARAVLWLDLTLRRSHQDATTPLNAAAAELDLQAWPGPLVSLYQDRMSPVDMLAAAQDPDPAVLAARDCEAAFYSGAHALAEGQPDLARNNFQQASGVCPATALESAAAKAEFVQVAAGEPENALADMIDCQAAVVDDDANAVIAACGRALQDGIPDPQQFNVLLKRGEAYDRVGDEDHAIADLERAIALAPDSPRAYLLRGRARLHKGEIEGAIADISYAMGFSPDSANLYMERGWIYQGRGDSAQAIADFTKAIALGANTTKIYLSRGIAADLQGDDARAIADFEQAIQLAPNGAPYATLWLALALHRTHQEQDPQLKTAADALDPDAWPRPILRFLMHGMSEDDLTKAAVDPDPAVAGKQDCEASFYIGEVDRADGRDAAAKTRFEHMRDVCPRDLLEYIAALVELGRM